MRRVQWHQSYLAFELSKVAHRSSNRAAQAPAIQFALEPPSFTGWLPIGVPTDLISMGKTEQLAENYNVEDWTPTTAVQLSSSHQHYSGLLISEPEIQDGNLTELFEDAAEFGHNISVEYLQGILLNGT